MTLPALTETLTQIFTDILPQYGFTLREKQIELAEHILNVISRRGITLAESEVGTGKTLAYLTAAGSTTSTCAATIQNKAGRNRRICPLSSPHRASLYRTRL